MIHASNVHASPNINTEVKQSTIKISKVTILFENVR
jgi:hypothetical protein